VTAVPKEILVKGVIAILEEDLLAAVAALGHVIGDVLQHNAGDS
jgi:hypothetical protein